jgi:hypothetical protein
VCEYCKSHTIKMCAFSVTWLTRCNEVDIQGKTKWWDGLLYIYYLFSIHAFFYTLINRNNIETKWFCLRLWCLTPLSTILQLYRGGQLCWWRSIYIRARPIILFFLECLLHCTVWVMWHWKHTSWWCGFYNIHSLHAVFYTSENKINIET